MKISVPNNYTPPIMRINAHIASAILPTDKRQFGCSYSPGMKKRQINMEVITAQKAEINNIMVLHGVNTTTVAKKAGVAPSTINRFMSANPPANALSAVTMTSIRDAWPSFTQDRPERNITDSEMGILKSIEVIFAILTARKMVKDTDLESILVRQAAEFRTKNLSGAIAVIDELIDSLGLKPRESGIQAIRKLL